MTIPTPPSSPESSDKNKQNLLDAIRNGVNLKHIPDSKMAKELQAAAVGDSANSVHMGTTPKPETASSAIDTSGSHRGSVKAAEKAKIVTKVLDQLISSPQTDSNSTKTTHGPLPSPSDNTTVSKASQVLNAKEEMANETAPVRSPAASTNTDAILLESSSKHAGAVKQKEIATQTEDTPTKKSSSQTAVADSSAVSSAKPLQSSEKKSLTADKQIEENSATSASYEAGGVKESSQTSPRSQSQQQPIGNSDDDDAEVLITHNQSFQPARMPFQQSAAAPGDQEAEDVWDLIRKNRDVQLNPPDERTHQIANHIRERIEDEIIKKSVPIASQTSYINENGHKIININMTQEQLANCQICYPRYDQNNKPIRDDNGKIVYDVIKYGPDGRIKDAFIAKDAPGNPSMPPEVMAEAMQQVENNAFAERNHHSPQLSSHQQNQQQQFSGGNETYGQRIQGEPQFRPSQPQQYFTPMNQAQHAAPIPQFQTQHTPQPGYQLTRSKGGMTVTSTYDLNGNRTGQKIEVQSSRNGTPRTETLYLDHENKPMGFETTEKRSPQAEAKRIAKLTKRVVKDSMSRERLSLNYIDAANYGIDISESHTGAIPKLKELATKTPGDRFNNRFYGKQEIAKVDDAYPYHPLQEPERPGFTMTREHQGKDNSMVVTTAYSTEGKRLGHEMTVVSTRKVGLWGNRKTITRSESLTVDDEGKISFRTNDPRGPKVEARRIEKLMSRMKKHDLRGPKTLSDAKMESALTGEEHKSGIMRRIGKGISKTARRVKSVIPFTNNVYKGESEIQARPMSEVNQVMGRPADYGRNYEQMQQSYLTQSLGSQRQQYPGLGGQEYSGIYNTYNSSFPTQYREPQQRYSNTNSQDPFAGFNGIGRLGQPYDAYKRDTTSLTQENSQRRQFSQTETPNSNELNQPTPKQRQILSILYAAEQGLTGVPGQEQTMQSLAAMRSAVSSGQVKLVGDNTVVYTAEYNTSIQHDSPTRGMQKTQVQDMSYNPQFFPPTPSPVPSTTPIPTMSAPPVVTTPPHDKWGEDLRRINENIVSANSKDQLYAAAADLKYIHGIDDAVITQMLQNQHEQHPASFGAEVDTARLAKSPYQASGQEIHDAIARLPDESHAKRQQVEAFNKLATAKDPQEMQKAAEILIASGHEAKAVIGYSKERFASQRGEIADLSGVAAKGEQVKKLQEQLSESMESPTSVEKIAENKAKTTKFNEYLNEALNSKEGSNAQTEYARMALHQAPYDQQEKLREGLQKIMPQLDSAKLKTQYAEHELAAKEKLHHWPQTSKEREAVEKFMNAGASRLPAAANELIAKGADHDLVKNNMDAHANSTVIVRGTPLMRNSQESRETATKAPVLMPPQQTVSSLPKNIPTENVTAYSNELDKLAAINQPKPLPARLTDAPTGIAKPLARELVESEEVLRSHAESIMDKGRKQECLALIDDMKGKDNAKAEAAAKSLLVQGFPKEDILPVLNKTEPTTPTRDVSKVFTNEFAKACENVRERMSAIKAPEEREQMEQALKMLATPSQNNLNPRVEAASTLRRLGQKESTLQHELQEIATETGAGRDIHSRLGKKEELVNSKLAAQARDGTSEEIVKKQALLITFASTKSEHLQQVAEKMVSAGFKKEDVDIKIAEREKRAGLPRKAKTELVLSIDKAEEAYKTAFTRYQKAKEAMAPGFLPSNEKVERRIRLVEQLNNANTGKANQEAREALVRDGVNSKKVDEAIAAKLLLQDAVEALDKAKAAGHGFDASHGLTKEEVAINTRLEKQAETPEKQDLLSQFNNSNSDKFPEMAAKMIEVGFDPDTVVDKISHSYQRAGIKAPWEKDYESAETLKNIEQRATDNKARDKEKIDKAQNLPDSKKYLESQGKTIAQTREEREAFIDKQAHSERSSTKLSALKDELVKSDKIPDALVLREALLKKDHGDLVKEYDSAKIYAEKMLAVSKMVTSGHFDQKQVVDNFINDVAARGEPFPWKEETLARKTDRIHIDAARLASEKYDTALNAITEQLGKDNPAIKRFRHAVNGAHAEEIAKEFTQLGVEPEKVANLVAAQKDHLQVKQVGKDAVARLEANNYPAHAEPAQGHKEQKTPQVPITTPTPVYASLTPYTVPATATTIDPGASQATTPSPRSPIVSESEREFVTPPSSPLPSESHGSNRNSELGGSVDAKTTKEGFRPISPAQSDHTEIKPVETSNPIPDISSSGYMTVEEVHGIKGQERNDASAKSKASSEPTYQNISNSGMPGLIHAPKPQASPQALTPGKNAEISFSTESPKVEVPSASPIEDRPKSAPPTNGAAKEKADEVMEKLTKDLTSSNSPPPSGGGAKTSSPVVPKNPSGPRVSGR